MKVFLSYPYRDHTQSYIDAISSVLAASGGIEVIDGKHPNPTKPLAPQILERIKQSDLLVIFEWQDSPSRWVDNEIGVAAGASIPTMLVTDAPELHRGLIADHFHIDMDGGEAFVCAEILRANAEIADAPSVAPPDLPKDLAPALKGKALALSDYFLNSKDELASRYRTASNLKLTGYYDQALIHYGMVIDEDPNHFLSLYNIGSCLMYSERLPEARTSFLNLIERIGPTAWKSDEELRTMLFGAYMQLYCIEEKQGKLSEGEQWLLKSLEVRPDDAHAYVNLVICNLKRKQFERANELYRILMQHPLRSLATSDLSEEDTRLLEELTKRKPEETVEHEN